MAQMIQQKIQRKHVQNMGKKPKQNRRPNHAKNLKLQGKSIFNYIQPKSLKTKPKTDQILTKRNEITWEKETSGPDDAPSVLIHSFFSFCFLLVFLCLLLFLFFFFSFCILFLLLIIFLFFLVFNFFSLIVLHSLFVVVFSLYLLYGFGCV